MANDESLDTELALNCWTFFGLEGMSPDGQAFNRNFSLEPWRNLRYGK